MEAGPFFEAAGETTTAQDVLKNLVEALQIEDDIIVTIERKII